MAKAPTTKELGERVEKLETGINNLQEGMTSMIEMMREQAPPKSDTPEPPETPHEQETANEQLDEKMLPKSWLKVFHKHLGADFQYFLEEGGAGSHAVRVVFPANIDRRVGTERSTGERDVSMASPIRVASPLADIESWCKLIIQTIKRAPGHEDFKPKN
jgi:hypothetical protein